MPVKTIFYSTERSGVDYELECFVNDFDEIFICIERENDYPSYVCLDKSAAIKLSKVLRTEINKIQ